MALQKAGLILTAQDAAKFQQDIKKSSQAVRDFGTTTAEVQARLARGSTAFTSITDRTAALRTGILRTRVAINEFGTTIDAELADADAKFEQAFKAERLREFADELSRVGTVMLATGAAAGALIVATGLQASRIEELGVLLEVTRQNAIYMAEAEGNLAKAASFTSEAVQAQVQGIRDLHLSGEVANKTVAELIRYNLDWTRATELARLAQDAATFAMQDSSEAVSGLVHGIATLQPRVLRTYGLMINLNEAYRRYSETNNVVAKELTTAQRQQAAFNEVLRLAPSISGAYEAAMTTASKQVRSFKTDIVNLSEAFGEEYTPALGAAVGAMRDVLHALTEMSDPWQAFISWTAISATGLTLLGGAFLKIVPRIIIAANELRILASAATMAELAFAGLTGAVLLGIPALIGFIAAQKRAEGLRREEAAGILTSSENYDEYVAALKRAELSNYALTESLYDTIKAHQEATDAAEAQAEAESLLAEAQETSRLLMVGRALGGLTAFTEYIRENIAAVTDERLALYANEEALYRLAMAQGYGVHESKVFAKTLSELARQQQFVRDTWEAGINEVKDWDYHARLAAEKTDLLADAHRRLDVSLAAVNWSASRKEIADTIAAHEELTKALEAQEKAYEKFDRQAAEATIAAQDKAIEARIKAEEDKNEALEDLAKDYAKRAADIYEDLAQVEIDLQKEIVEAEREAAQERLELQQELASDLAELDRELAQDREDLARDRQRALADLEREYQQDRKDAQRDLNRDLEDLERDLGDKQREIREDYLQDLLALEEEYAAKRQAIENKYAQAEQDIEKKYQTEPELTYQEQIDARREALLEELRLLQESREEHHGIVSRREKEILELLEQLKQEELALLEEQKQKELEALEEQKAKEKEEREKALEEELAQAKAAYEKRREERLRQYEQELEDLKRRLEQDRAKIRRDYDEKFADLQRQHERERAEALRRNAEALADLDKKLAEEKARLEAAAEEDRQRLAEKLADEKANNAERRQELQDDYAKRLGIIDTEEQKEIDEIEAKNAIKKQDWVDTYEAIYDSTKARLENVLINAVRPGLQSIVDEHKARIQDILDAWNNSGLPGQSPSPFFKDMAKSWAEGIKAGFDDTAFQANVNSVIGDLQAQIQTALPPQQVSMPLGMGERNVTNSRTSNVTVNASYAQAQSEASLRDDLSLWNSMMRAWGR